MQYRPRSTMVSAKRNAKSCLWRRYELTLKSQKCNMLFTRILEAGDKPSSIAKQTPRETSRGHTSRSRVLDQEPGSDSDDEDIQGFVRITLISRLKQANTFTREFQNYLSPLPLQKCCLQPKPRSSKPVMVHDGFAIGLWKKKGPKPFLIGKPTKIQCVRIGHYRRNNSGLP